MAVVFARVIEFPRLDSLDVLEGFIKLFGNRLPNCLPFVQDRS